MKESLLKYYNKNVIIKAKNGKSYKGFISDYVYPESNENNQESILMEDPFIEFYPNQIEEIEIIEQKNLDVN